MLWCLSVVNDDGNGATGNNDNNDNNVDNNGATGDNDNDDRDGATDDKVN